MYIVEICHKYKYKRLFHSKKGPGPLLCMPSPLVAPDPIRVKACVCCQFWINRIRILNLSIGAISKWIYTETLVGQGPKRTLS